MKARKVTERTIPAEIENVPSENLDEKMDDEPIIESTNKEEAEGKIVFEQVDFERLEEMPKY